jgi:hypothetical protein
MVKLDPGSNRFPAVIAVDANKRGDAVDLIFLTRIEGQGARPWKSRSRARRRQCIVIPPNSPPD